METIRVAWVILAEAEPVAAWVDGCASLFLTHSLNPYAHKLIYRVSWCYLSLRQLPPGHRWLRHRHGEYLPDSSPQAWAWFSLPLINSVKWICFAIKADHQRKLSRFIDLIVVSAENEQFVLKAYLLGPLACIQIHAEQINPRGGWCGLWAASSSHWFSK